MQISYSSPPTTMAGAANSKAPIKTRYYYLDKDEELFVHGNSPKDKIKSELYRVNEDTLMLYTYYEGAEGVRKGDVKKIETFHVYSDCTRIRHGPYSSFYEDGRLHAEATYLFGKLVGEEFEYDREGNVTHHLNHLS